MRHASQETASGSTPCVPSFDIDHIGHALAALRGRQPRTAGGLGEHGALLQDRPGVAQDAIDRDLRGRGDVLGALTGADTGLDVARETG